MKKKINHSFGRRMLSFAMVLLMAFPWVSTPAMAAVNWSNLEITVSWTDGGNTQSATASALGWTEESAFWVQVSSNEPFQSLTLSIYAPGHDDYQYDAGAGVGNLVLTNVKNASGVNSKDAIYITAYDGGGNQLLPSIILYISTSIAPTPTPEPTEEPTPKPPVNVPVLYKAEDGSILHETSVSVLPGENKQVQVDTGKVSSDYELNDSGTKTASVNEDGTFEPVVFFFKLKPLEPVNVPVLYKSEDGSVLHETSVSVLPGASKEVQVDTGKVSSDYELNDSGTKTASVNEDGTFEPVVFFFKLKPLEPVNVPVLYKAEDGSVLHETSVSVLPGASKEVQVDTGKVSSDYELNDSGTKTASVNEDGTFEPVVFFFKLKPLEPVNVLVLYKAEDGSVLYETSVSVLPGASKEVQVDTSKVSSDYELNDSGTKTASVNADGSFEPVVFFFKLKPLEPVNVSVLYKAEDGSVLHETSVSVLPGASKEVQVDTSKVSSDYELNDSGTKTASVNADGSFEPVVFFFKLKPLEAVNVPVLYKAEDGSVLHETSVSVLPGASKEVQVDTSKVSSDYELNDSGTKTASVNADGTFEPVVFFFRLKPLEAVNVPVLYKAEDGSVLYETSVSVLPGASKEVQVDTSKVSSDYELNDSNTKTASVNADGTFEPVVFFFRLKPLEAVNVPVLYKAENGSVLHETSVSVLPGESKQVQVDTSKVSSDYELNDSNTKTASVNADGSFEPVVFLFKLKITEDPPVTQVEIPIKYLGENDTVIYQGKAIVVPGSGADILVDLTKAPGYVLNDDSVKTVFVDENGTPSLQEIIFRFRLEAEPVPVDVPVLYMGDDGEVFYNTTVTVNPGSSKPVSVDPARVPKEYTLNDESTKTAYVSESGVPEPEQIVFLFSYHAPEEPVNTPTPTPTPTLTPTPTPTSTITPSPSPVETPIPVGSPVDRWGMTNTGSLNFRSGPSTGTAAIGGKLAKDLHVWVYETQFNDKNEVWARVRVNDTDGYLMAMYVDILSQAESDAYQATLVTPMPTRTPEPSNTNTPTPTPTPVTTVTPTPLPGQYAGYALTNRQVALRMEVSSSDQSILATLPVNTLVYVVGQVYQGGEPWSLVETLDKVTGYVQDDALRRITPEEAKYYIDQYNAAHPTATPTPSPTPSPTPVQQSGYAATLGDNVPMRGAADPNSMLVNMLVKDAVVFVSGQEYIGGKTWHIVKYLGQWGYIRADQLRWLSQAETEAYLNSLNTPTPTPPAATPPPLNENSLSSYGYVTTNSVNFRAAPGNGTRIRTLNKYAFALVTGSTQVDGKTWYKVNQAGTDGYISGDYFHVLTLAELEEFLQSPEYSQGATGGTGGTGGNNNSGSNSPPTSLEDLNTGTWTNPNTGLNATYEPFDPYATPDPVPTPSPSPTPEPFETLPPPTSTPVLTQADGPNLGIWLGLGATLLAGFGGLYAYALHKSNQRKAAARAAQRRNAMQQNPQSGARPYARATNAPMVPPASGTQARPAPPTGAQRPPAPGSANPYSQRPAPTQPSGTAQRPVGTKPVQPGAVPTARPGQQPSAFARPSGAQPGAQPTAPYRTEAQGSAAAPDASGGNAQSSGALGSTTRQPRATRHAGNPPADQTTPTDTNENL